MAYVEVYFAQWDDFGGTTHEIKLLQEGGSGTTRIVNMAPIPFTHQIRGGKDTPIKRQIQGSEIKFNFEVASADIGTFDAVFERCVGSAEEERIVLKNLTDIEIEVKKMPSDFSKLNDSEFISKMKVLNQYVSTLEEMQSPTQKTVTKKDELLVSMREIISNNRDKLFKRNK